MTRHARQPVLLLVAVLLASAGLLVAPPAATADPGGAVVVGRVVDTSGHPLAGVGVWFVPGSSDVDPSPVLGATTGTDGRYQALLSAGNGSAQVYFDGAAATGPTSRSGYVTRFLRGADGSRTVISAGAGTTVRGTDAVLPPGAGISGTVTAGNGRPLGNVIASLQPSVPLPSADLPFETLPSAHTAADGSWSLRGLDLGTRASVTATVTFQPYAATGGASPTGYPSACLGPVAAPCGQGGPAPTSIRLAPGRMTDGADIVLPAAAELQGRLTTPDGQGINGAVVEVYGPARAADGGPPFQGGIATAPDGTWRQQGLFPGVAYAVCYGYRTGYVSTEGRDGPTFVPECSHDSPVTADFRAGTLYRAGAGQVARVDDSLTPNGSISGRIVDGNGNAVQNASFSVFVGRVDGRRLGPFRAVPQKGTFSLPGVPTGTVVVCATAPGFPQTCPPSRGPVTSVSVAPYRTTVVPDLVLVRS